MWKNKRTIYIAGIRYAGSLLVLFAFGWFDMVDFISSLSSASWKDVCTMDLLINGYSGFKGSYLVYTIILINVLLSVKEDFHYPKLYMTGSRIKLFMGQILCCIRRAAIYSSIYAVFLMALAFCYNKVSLNWNRQDSYFFRATQTVSEVNYKVVCGVMIVSLFLVWVVVQIQYVVASWLITSEAFKWILIFLIRFLVGGILHVPILMNISWKVWAQQKIAACMLIGIVLLLLLLAAGMVCAKRREFYGKKA